jgi:hypothetical protein
MSRGVPISVRSCSHVVFVDQPTDAVTADDPIAYGGSALDWPASPLRREQLKGPVRPMAVVVLDVGVEDAGEMTRPDDE